MCLYHSPFFLFLVILSNSKCCIACLNKEPRWLLLFIVFKNVFTHSRLFQGIHGKFTHRCFSGLAFLLFWKWSMHSFISGLLASCQDSLDNQQSKLKVFSVSWSVICLDQNADSFFFPIHSFFFFILNWAQHYT